MTDQQHRATPEQWALQERWGSHSCFEPDYDSSCILELRDRIAALEASVGIGQPVTPANTSAPADSLVYCDPACIAQWPDCYEGGYDPRCCRFPKSCSCEARTSIPVEPQPEPADSLVERVRSVVASADSASARAAIRAIAAAARAKDLDGQDRAVMSWSGFARWLEQEAES
jgi:hypothetical protein